MNIHDMRQKLKNIESDNTIRSRNMMVITIGQDGNKSVSNFTDEKKFFEFIEKVKKDSTIRSYHVSYEEKMEEKNG
jgi:hypothetical protein